MDWGTILTSAITALIMGAGSIFLFFVFFKQRKKKEDIDVIDKDASVAKNMLDFTTDYQLFVKTLTDKYQKDIDDNKKELDTLKIEMVELSIKMESVKKLLGNEHGRRRYAEKNICLLTDCKLRIPELGTYKSDEDEIDLKELLK